MVDWGRAELSFRSDAKNVPGVFVLKANILIPEAGIVAMPSPSLSEMKYTPFAKTSRPLALTPSPSFILLVTFSLSRCSPFYLPSFAIKNADIAPILAPFLEALPAITSS